MNEKPKEKGKTNPFASFLRPTEDLLWQADEKVTVAENVVPRMEPAAMLATGIFVIFIIGAVIWASRKYPNMSVFSVIGTIILVLAGYWVRHGLRGGTMVPALRNKALYAVTSERLFYQRGDDIRAVVLEKVTSINVIPTKGARGSLSFGGVFPQWSGLEDAEHLKSIIEQAQKDRRNSKQETSMSQSKS